MIDRHSAVRGRLDMAVLPARVLITFVTLIGCHSASSTTITCGSTGVQRTIEQTRAISGCSGLAQDSSVTLALVSQSGQTVILGSCTRTLTCTLRHTAVSSLVRPAASFVSMELFATRAMAGTLVCSQVFSNGTHDVVSPFEIVDISVTTNLEDWTLTADFSTSRVFSALGVYDVDIRENIAGISEVYFYRLNSATTQTSLTAYNSSSTQFYRGNLTAKWSMPNRGGNYYYTADLVPSRQTGLRIHPKNNGWINILEPAPPQTNCPLTFVPEVGPFNCQCSTKSLGRPAGRLQWLVGNDVIASGGYGVTQLQLPTNRVNRMHDGMQIRCQLDWVVKQHVFVTGSVAYGPKDLSIKVHSKKCLVIATCTVDDFKPFSSDQLQWGGLCQGQRGTVCTFTSRGADDDGKEITCTVTNHANNGHTISSRVKVTVSACGDKGNGVAANHTVIVVQSDSVIVSKSVAISISVTLTVTLIVEVSLTLALKWIRKRRNKNNNRGRDGDCVSTTGTSGILVKDTMASSVGASAGAALGVSVLVMCLVLVFLWIRRRLSAAGTKNESVDSRKDCQENHYSGLFEASSRETNQRNAKHSTTNSGCEPNENHNV